MDLFPAYANNPIRIEFWGDEIEGIREIDAISGSTIGELESYRVYPASQYASTKEKVAAACKAIEKELEERVAWFEKENLLLEAQRIRMRTEYDMEMLREIGFCNGIENYSRHLSGRKAGQRPWCLIDFFPEDFCFSWTRATLLLPQVGGMYRGDYSRKQNWWILVSGYLPPWIIVPSKPEEFTKVTGQTVYVIRYPSPTRARKIKPRGRAIDPSNGLLDPEMEIRPIKGQVEDCISEIKKLAQSGYRALVTTLTKRMTEDLTDFLREREIKVEYLHSDIDAIERVELLRNLRTGAFDVLVGVNLLREGLDLPEVALVVVLDADKEGFLRSETSLIQTAGRAARHEKGKVIFYADAMTQSLQRAWDACQYRREKQMAFNELHGIVPQSVVRPVQESLVTKKEAEKDELAVSESLSGKQVKKLIKELEQEMMDAVKKLEFEKAALLRDQVSFLQEGQGKPMSSTQGGAVGRRKYAKRGNRGKRWTK